MTSSVEIGHLPVSVVAAASRDRAEWLTRRVRDAVADHLPAALEAACGRALDADDRYMFIDRLNVQCAVSGHWDDEAIARAFAGALARAILSSVTAGGAVAFRDRPELVAAFMAAVPDGGAFSRWWFDEFSGLAALPPSAALRTLVLDDPSIARAALVRLTRDSLARVLDLLGDDDAERVVIAILAEACATATTGVTLPEVLEALAEAAAIADPEAGGGRLAALVCLERRRRGAADARSLALVDGVRALRRAARSGRLDAWLGSPTPGAWLMSPMPGAWLMSPMPGALPVSQMPDVDGVAACCAAIGLRGPWRHLSADDSRILLDDLRAVRRLAPAGIAASAESSSGYTAHGGALVLLALLARVGWWPVWRNVLVDRCDETASADRVASWLALAVVARALSARQPVAIASDPVLRSVAGADGSRENPGRTFSRRQLRQVLTAAVPALTKQRVASLDDAIRAAARRLLRELARRLPCCKTSTAEYLRHQCLACHASVVFGDRRMDVRLGRVPLDVLLRLAGLHRTDATLPDGRLLSIRSEEPS